MAQAAVLSAAYSPSLQLPGYAQHYPTLHRVPLAAVKHGIFHPNPPRFRRMEMDNTLHKLSSEHCRTTTTCGPRDFANSTSTILSPPPHRVHSMNATETGRKLHRQYVSYDDLLQSRLAWSDFLGKGTGRSKSSLPELESAKDAHFQGYAVRYLRPDLTKSWKFTLQAEPKLDQYGQRPIPANIYARYRDTYPQQHRNVASEMWR
ncbi:testis, prostate and placenta-expressed protein-like [Physella acuta]|uniref:testis, prostate and placenta-expressed protein-like n=1 Tax=Physella acuta TaxID=109671 RepID=UPI0027DC4615|nr:testis, prostate and placenta-expressed protein-like [Physella acuta]